MRVRAHIRVYIILVSILLFLINLTEEEEEGGGVIYKGEGLARNSPRLQMLDRDRKRE